MAVTTSDDVTNVEELSQRITRSVSSPFGPWSTDQNRITAIAMLSVYGSIFLAGLIGHVCVIAYTTTSRNKYQRCRRGALLILANLSSSQMLFLLCCLPSIAYKSIMNLSFSPWVLGDVICRMVPFIEYFILGVTVLSICILSIDRLQSAGRNANLYEKPGDSFLAGVCKLMVIWIGAMIIASPELFINGITTHTYEIPQNIFELITRKDSNIVKGILPQYHRLDNPRGNWEELSAFLEDVTPDFLLDDAYITSANNTFAVTYQYQKCESRVSLWSDAPTFLVIFAEIYQKVRLWWLFGYYFCFPVFFSLLFALIVALKLSRMHDQCLKESAQPVDGAVGTLNNHRGESLNRSNSVGSNQTLSSEAQQLMAVGLGTPHNGTLRSHNYPNVTHHRSASPANSYPGGAMTPMIVRACHTPLSPSEPTAGYTQSPITSPSIASQSHDVNGAGKASSLPPHGHGARTRGKMQKLIVYNISIDRALNTLLVALILAFSLTWLPQHIFQILFTKTQLGTALDLQYKRLTLDICQYFSVFSFAVNPIVIFFSYKSYRMFMGRFCCHCQRLC